MILSMVFSFIINYHSYNRPAQAPHEVLLMFIIIVIIIVFIINLIGQLRLPIRCCCCCVFWCAEGLRPFELYAFV
jgi:hypothetical protein